MVKVLIVDDSNFSQKITCNLLKKFLDNAEFFFASDGREGFDRYEEVNPDYVFVDLLMPNISGEQLISLLKQYDANCKVIVVSADVQKNVRKEIESYNIISFVNKPFNEEKAKFICDKIRNDRNGK